MGNLGQQLQQDEFDEFIHNLSNADLILLALRAFNDPTKYHMAMEVLYEMEYGESIPKTVDITPEHWVILTSKMEQVELEMTSRFNREVWTIQ